MQERRNSSELAMGLRLSCTYPSIYACPMDQNHESCDISWKTFESNILINKEMYFNYRKSQVKIAETD